MDEKTAWENFTSSGSVADYLKYCQVKNEISQNKVENISSGGFYDKNRRSDTKRTECR